MPDNDKPQDDCILLYIMTPGTSVRGVAVDYEGHVWAGGCGWSDSNVANKKYLSRHNGITGAFMYMAKPYENQLSYGLAFTSNKNLWSSLRGKSCFAGLRPEGWCRKDPANPSVCCFSKACLTANPDGGTPVTPWKDTSPTYVSGGCKGLGHMVNTYGITVDSHDRVYGASDAADGIGRWKMDGTGYEWSAGVNKVCDYPAGITSLPIYQDPTKNFHSSPPGVATGDDEVWAACRGTGLNTRDRNTVSRSKMVNGHWVSIAKFPKCGRDGVGVDSKGRIWGVGVETSGHKACTGVTNCASNIGTSCASGTGNYFTRIDPTANGGKGAVDMRICSKAGAYTYGDMTGNTRVASGGSKIEGQYHDVFDSGLARTLWTTLQWNENTGYCDTTVRTCSFYPTASDTIEAEVRAFDDATKWDATPADLPYTKVNQGEFLKLPQGQYLQVQITLSKASLDDDGPTLFNIRATYETALLEGRAAADTKSPLLSWCPTCPSAATLTAGVFASSTFPDVIAADFGAAFAPIGDSSVVTRALAPVAFFASSQNAMTGKATVTSTLRGDGSLRPYNLGVTITKPPCGTVYTYETAANLPLESTKVCDKTPCTFKWTDVESGLVLSDKFEQYWPDNNGLVKDTTLSPGVRTFRLQVTDANDNIAEATVNIELKLSDATCSDATTCATDYCVAPDPPGTGDKKCCATNGCKGHGSCQDAADFGKCVCKAGYTGIDCGECATGYFHYPHCRKCDPATTCAGHGVCKTDDVNKDGEQCTCDTGFSTATGECGGCGPGFHFFPTCTACSDDTKCDRVSLSNSLTHGTYECYEKGDSAKPLAPGPDGKVEDTCKPKCDSGYHLKISGDGVSAIRTCGCAKSWLGTSSSCQPPTFFFDENPTIFKRESSNAMILKVKRAMPEGMLDAHVTKVRVKSVDSTLSGGTDLDYEPIDEVLTFVNGSVASIAHVQTFEFASRTDGLWEMGEHTKLTLTIEPNYPGILAAPHELDMIVMENEPSEFRFHVSAINNNGIHPGTTQISLMVERLVSLNIAVNVGIRLDAATSSSNLLKEDISFPQRVPFKVGEVYQNFTLVCEECIRRAGLSLDERTVGLAIYDIDEQEWEEATPIMTTVKIYPLTASPTHAPTEAPTMKPTELSIENAGQYVGSGENQVAIPIILGVALAVLLLLLALAAIVIVALALAVARRKRVKLKNTTALELSLGHLNVSMEEQSGIARGMVHIPSPADGALSVSSNPMHASNLASPNITSGPNETSST
jgi:hypothetical protein